MANCRKCEGVGTIILRKKDYYCRGCFLNATNHKFRASIGKNKILSRNENVLICLSGGVGSTVLLDLVHNGLSQDAHKKLRVTPFFLHLTDFRKESHNTDLVKFIIKQCEQYGFKVYIVEISDYMLPDSHLDKTNMLPSMNCDSIDNFHGLLHNMPATARNDFIAKVKRDMYIRIAKKLDCKFVFTAETTTTLAINLLTSIAIGRGSQIENDIGFFDNRGEIKVLKPMKDITKEELEHYIIVKGIEPVHEFAVEDSSLQSIITSFVTDIQDNYQATISTVCKTADKISDQDYNEGSGNCVICKSDFGKNSGKLSALEATNYSRTISLTQPQDIEEVQQLTSINSLNSSMFPFIHKSLCYSCSRNYSEMTQCALPKHIQESL